MQMHKQCEFFQNSVNFNPRDDQAAIMGPNAGASFHGLRAAGSNNFSVLMYSMMQSKEYRRVTKSAGRGRPFDDI